MITVHGFTRSKVQGSVTAFFWRWRVPEACSLHYQISYAIKFERSLFMRSGNPAASRPLQRGFEGNFSNTAPTYGELTIAAVNTQTLREGHYENSLLDG